MLANYNGKTYLYVSNKRRTVIVTRQEYKTDGGFIKDGDLFFKHVREYELSDIFSVEIWVQYHTGLEHTPSFWQVDEECGGIENDQVMLRFAEGILPGWEIEDKNVCKKYVDYSDISTCRLVMKYKKYAGEALVIPKIEEKYYPIKEAMDLYEQYWKSNL